MGYVASPDMKEWCTATLQAYQSDGLEVPIYISNFCHRILYGSPNAGKVIKTYRKTRTKHRKNTNSKKRRIRKKR